MKVLSWNYDKQTTLRPDRQYTVCTKLTIRLDEAEADVFRDEAMGLLPPDLQELLKPKFGFRRVSREKDASLDGKELMYRMIDEENPDAIIH